MVRSPKTLHLSLSNMQSQTDFVMLMKVEGFQLGDKVAINIGEEGGKSLMVLGLFLSLGTAFHVYFQNGGKSKRIAGGSRILEDLFAGKDAIALEEALETTYGVEIELLKEDAEEQAYWNTLSLQSLATAYGADEPDYEHLVQDSNPHFKPNPNYNL